MPLHLVFEASGVARVTATGQVAFDELLAVHGSLFTDAGFVDPMRLLWDLSQGRVALSGPEIRKLADYVRAHRPRGRARAAVVVADELSFGVVRMYELSLDDAPAEVRVFRDGAAASSWLVEEF
jgi:hypothetical protein